MAPGVWDFLASAYPLGHVCVSVCLEAEQGKGSLSLSRSERSWHSTKGEAWSLQGRGPRCQRSSCSVSTFSTASFSMGLSEWCLLTLLGLLLQHHAHSLSDEFPSFFFIMTRWTSTTTSASPHMTKEVSYDTWHRTKEDSEIDKADLEDKLWRLLYFSDPGKLLAWKSHAITIHIPLHIINHAWREVIRKGWNEDYIQIKPLCILHLKNNWRKK